MSSAKKTDRIDQAVILAAGEGTRLRPLTSTRPKPMLPVAGKPFLKWDLDALADSGIKKVYIVVGYKAETIQTYFGKKYRNMSIEYVVQKEQLGTGNAVSQVKDKITGTFLVMNGDVLVSSKLVKSFIKNHIHDASMCLIRVDSPEKFGIVEVKRGVITSLVEKPKSPKSNLANAGLYVFNKNIFECLNRIKKSQRLEYELTDAIKILIRQGKVGAYKCEEQWIDIGRPWDLLDANEIILKNEKLKVDKKAIIEDYAIIKGEVHIGSGTIIRSGSYIVGPVYIGRDCVIGPNCFIRAYSTIHNRCFVGNGVEIKNSIILPDTHIGHLSYIGDSIIGKNCNFGAGTKVANLRFDNADVKVQIRESLQTSGRRKFGCIMGDNVKTGINVSIMPGRCIYPGAYVEAASVVRNTIYTE